MTYYKYHTYGYAPKSNVVYVNDTLNEIIGKEDEKNIIPDDKQICQVFSSCIMVFIISIIFVYACIADGYPNAGLITGICGCCLTCIIGYYEFSSFISPPVINEQRKKRIGKNREKFDNYVNEIIDEQIKHRTLKKK